MPRRAFLRPFRRPPGDGPDAPLLVCVFLRGGADGLSLVPPHGDDDYQRLRPTLGLRGPSDSGVDATRRAIDLDGFFGLHPSLAPLVPLWREGELGVVHAVGSDDVTRSHFEAQDQMEHGDDPQGTGWLARLLRTSDVRRSLSAVALGTRLPESLRGAPNAAVFERADEHRVGGDDSKYLRALAALYAGSGPMAASGREALSTVERLRSLPAGSPGYPDAPLGRRLRELARLVRGRIGVRVACVDADGWDTHFVQATGFAERARVLGESLLAFRRDLGRSFGRTTVLVLTEFGRRAYENGSAGTDHGRASVMFVLGEGAGGPVRAQWPGLSASALEGPGDLRVTTDYRQAIVDALGAPSRPEAAQWPRAAVCFNRV